MTKILLSALIAFPFVSFCQSDAHTILKAVRISLSIDSLFYDATTLFTDTRNRSLFVVGEDFVCSFNDSLLAWEVLDLVPNHSIQFKSYDVRFVPIEQIFMSSTNVWVNFKLTELNSDSLTICLNINSNSYDKTINYSLLTFYFYISREEIVLKKIKREPYQWEMGKPFINSRRRCEN